MSCECETRMSMLFISHDLAVVRTISDRVMVMSHGEVREVAARDELFCTPAIPIHGSCSAPSLGFATTTIHTRRSKQQRHGRPRKPRGLR